MMTVYREEEEEEEASPSRPMMCAKEREKREKPRRRAGGTREQPNMREEQFKCKDTALHTSENWGKREREGKLHCLARPLATWPLVNARGGGGLCRHGTVHLLARGSCVQWCSH